MCIEFILLYIFFSFLFHSFRQFIENHIFAFQFYVVYVFFLKYTLIRRQKIKRNSSFFSFFFLFKLRFDQTHETLIQVNIEFFFSFIVCWKSLKIVYIDLFFFFSIINFYSVSFSKWIKLVLTEMRCDVIISLWKFACKFGVLIFK